jgi:hypothetical protein
MKAKKNLTPKTKTEPETIRTFDRDERDKPRLHNYAVGLAYKSLQLAYKSARALEDESRVSCHIMAGALREAMRQEIIQSAAHFEAAALLFAGLEPPKQTIE